MSSFTIQNMNGIIFFTDNFSPQTSLQFQLHNYHKAEAPFSLKNMFQDNFYISCALVLAANSRVKMRKVFANGNYT